MMVRPLRSWVDQEGVRLSGKKAARFGSFYSTGAHVAIAVLIFKIADPARMRPVRLSPTHYLR